MAVNDFFNLASNTADIYVVYPDLTIFYVLSEETNLNVGTVASTINENSHRSLIANNVPLLNILLNPLLSTLARLLYARYFNSTFLSAFILILKTIALFWSPTEI